jgi:hypothetical protein
MRLLCYCADVTDTCLTFLHLPKTGGTTFTTLLRWQYRSLSPEEIRWFATDDPSFEGLRKLPIEQRARLKVLMGHFPYGIHRSIPKRCTYVTIIRDPVKRVVSEFRYALTSSTHPMHDTVVSSSMDLEDYVVGRHSAQTQNALTRQLAGQSGEGELTRHDLEIASANLRGFEAVGLTEAFDESMILFKRVLGWSTPFYFSRNVSKRGTNPGNVSDRTISVIRERNVFDAEIYALARSLFGSLVAKYDDGFDREVTRFKLMNRGPRALGRFLDPVAPMIRRRLERKTKHRPTHG